MFRLIALIGVVLVVCFVVYCAKAVIRNMEETKKNLNQKPGPKESENQPK